MDRAGAAEARAAAEFRAGQTDLYLPAAQVKIFLWLTVS
jgi:hypothetical protein